jgi:hypothetical protein
MIQTKELIVTTLIAAIPAIMITPSIAHAQSALEIHNGLHSQLTAHSYDVAPGDQFLQQTVSTIHSSQLWTDTQKSAIITSWDEDYNNLHLGIGHGGEVVPVQTPHNP